MAQTNYTPISLYYSTTASAVPTAANLVQGELAINTADGKLYYEDSSGVVQVLATKSTGSIGGSNTQVQFNNSGSLGGSSGLTWDGSFLTTSSIKNSALTSGRVTYAGASGLLSDNANFVYDSSERLIVGASSAAIGNRMEVVSNTGSQAIGIRGRVSDGAGVISWHPNASATEYARIQSDSNSALIFGTGSSGTERMRITSAGNVGIGASSPNQLLTLGGSAGTQALSFVTTAYLGDNALIGNIEFSTNSAGGGYDNLANIRAYKTGTNTNDGALTFWTKQGASSEKMRIDSSGNVGIGTSSPSYTLDVTGQIRASSGASASALIATSTSSGGTALNIQNSGTVNALIGGWLSCIGSGNATDVAIAAYQGALGFATNGANIRMTLDSSGNLGLGVTPSAWGTSGAVFKAMEYGVVGNAIAGISNGSSMDTMSNAYYNSGWKYANSSRPALRASLNGDVSGAFTWNQAASGTAGAGITWTQAMTLDASGNLLVGTTSTITGTKFGATSTTTSGAGEFYVNSAGADAVNAINIIKYSTTNTTAQQFIGFTINNANTGSGQINANGASQAAFGSFSDARLKENIVDLPSQLNNILALKPKEFDYIQSEGGGHQIGFVAQDMQTVYPDAISERTDGMLVVTGWSKTEARLVKAIQELKAEFDEYKATHP